MIHSTPVNSSQLSKLFSKAELLEKNIQNSLPEKIKMLAYWSFLCHSSTEWKWIKAWQYAQKNTGASQITGILLSNILF